MKITFDTDKIFNFQDGFDSVNQLGNLLLTFIHIDGIYPYLNKFPQSSEWKVVTDTPRPLLIAVMGDTVYDIGTYFDTSLEPKWTHLRHVETGLNVVWYHGSDLTILFHREGEDGFTITNRGNSLNTWESVSLDDPRNDPEYNPYS